MHNHLPTGYPQPIHKVTHRVTHMTQHTGWDWSPTPGSTAEHQHHPTHPPPRKDADTTTPNPTHYHGTHAMDHQQPTRTTPKKLEPTQKRNTANNKRKMRRPRNPRMGHRVLGGRTPRHPLRRPPMARHQLHNTRHRHRPHPTRRSKQPNQPPTPVPPMPRLQDHGRGPRHTRTQDTHANTTNTTTSMRHSTKQNETKRKAKTKQNKRNAKRNARTRNLKRNKNPLRKNDRHPWR